jgi:hypothetical protein
MRSDEFWSGVREQYEAGGVSIRSLAREHKVSEGAIRKRRDVEGWKAPEQAYSPPAVSPPWPDRQAENVQDQDDADPNDLGVEVARRMLDELSSVTSNIGEIEDMIWEETAGDRDGQRRQAMMRAVSLGGRAQTLKTLGQALSQFQEKTGQKGKKEQRKDAAAKAATGKFAPRTPPKLVVDNK